MAPGAATKTAETAGGAGRCHRASADQRSCRSVGRTLFPCDILVLGNRHRRNLAAVHHDGPGAGTTLSRLCEGETILDAAQVRLLQYGLPSLLCPMVVLALVLLVVGDVRHPTWSTVSDAELYGGCFGYQFGAN